MSDEFGATVLTDCKNGSDKPTDDTIRLTLIRTPGTAGGYPDQATQDIGHHEFVYGIAGHGGDWRHGQTDWQGQRLNQPLIGFTTARHSGVLSKEFSLVKIDNSRIRLLALKKAEQGDEWILRLVELDGRPQTNVHVSFTAPIATAREVNGQEQPVGCATLEDGALVTSFSAYQPRTFALRLGSAPVKLPEIHSAPVDLRYTATVVSHNGEKSGPGFDGKGNTLPAEMLPSEINFDDVNFRLPTAKMGSPDAIVAKGQTIKLPAGNFSRVYILAASNDGDQKATFDVGGKPVELNIQDWGGFIGQWDDRQWTSVDSDQDHYGEMTGVKPGYIKRGDLAWYCSHHHNQTGENIPYAYSYLFAYELQLPQSAQSIKLPNNQNVLILAMSAAELNPKLQPIQPLYDTLPLPALGTR